MGKRIYFGFNFRFVMCSLLIILFSFFAAFFFRHSFLITGEKSIDVYENSNLDYRVYLKKNDFYDSDYLGKDMVYVASLIDRIDVDFNYIFNIDCDSDIEFFYDVVGKLVISDNSNGNVFFEKEYVLIDGVRDNIYDSNLYEIKEEVSIDYEEYNDFVNQFRSKYGVDAKSSLVVYLRVKEKGNSFDFDNYSEMSLVIPLSMKAINIVMDYNDVNKKSKLVDDSEFVISNYFYVFLGFLFVILLMFVFRYYVKLLLSIWKRKSVYDRYIDKILREYDRLIVETDTAPNMKNNIIYVDRFQELLDVRDNLGLPIKFYVIKMHEKCQFYINHGRELYLCTVKAVDLEEDNM